MRKTSVISNKVNPKQINIGSSHFDSNHAKSNQFISSDLSKIGSINDSTKICTLHQILSWDRYSMDASASTVYNITPLDYISSIHTPRANSLVHSLHSYPPVPASPIFTNGTSEPPSPSHKSSSYWVTPKVNTTPCNNAPNPVPNVPAEPDSYTNLSYSYLSVWSDSSDDNYSNWIQRTEIDKYKNQSKMHFNDPINKCAKLTTKLLTAAHKPNVIEFKLNEDPL